MKKKAAAAVLAAVFFLYSTGCATIGGKKLKPDEARNAIGAACVLAGLGAGAYAGASLAGGNDRSFSSGVAGGLLGAITAGGVYWLIVNLTGEQVDADDGGNTLPADDNMLLPKE